jgi:hypothetical protein
VFSHHFSVGFVTYQVLLIVLTFSLLLPYVGFWINN